MRSAVARAQRATHAPGTPRVSESCPGSKSSLWLDNDSIVGSPCLIVAASVKVGEETNDDGRAAEDLLLFGALELIRSCLLDCGDRLQIMPADHPRWRVWIVQFKRGSRLDCGASKRWKLTGAPQRVRSSCPRGAMGRVTIAALRHMHGRRWEASSLFCHFPHWHDKAELAK